MQELDRVVKKKFSRSDGPFVKSLDRVLSSFHVERQAYYGGTFVGNHVHSCLKVSIEVGLLMFTFFRCVYRTYTYQANHINMCDSVPALALLQCPSLVTRAQQIAKRHQKALVLFSNCHNKYENIYVDVNEVDKLCK